MAAIDCGTNSIRLLVTAGGQDLVRQMRIVRLGQGVDRTGRLDPQAIERTRVALAGYRELIDGHGAEKVRMVATSASRDASNAADFQRMVLGTLGQPAEVISGREEAELSFLGAVAGLPGGTDYVVVDIGGGSTEFVRGTGDRVSAAVSTNIGCVRMTERHVHSDPPTPSQLAALDADVENAVRQGLEVGVKSARLVGLAGSVTTVAALALSLADYDSERIHHSVLTAEEVARVTEQLSIMDHAARAALNVIHPGRVDVIIAGARILHTIMKLSGQPDVIVSEHDILDGIAASLSPHLPGTSQNHSLDEHGEHG
ncbi:Ppx/GppA phosphatase family protein [Rhizocola hellebori]|uniref:Ppx/GppA phosphatase family protein n=1 Tax=Rhizocola hellebori TaxID=1392758 RepID=UPI003570A70A